MRKLLFLCVLLIAASHRLHAAGCAQVTVVDPTLTCQDLVPLPGPAYDPRCGQGAHGVFDNAGGLIAGRSNISAVVRTPAGLSSTPQTIAVVQGGSQVYPDGYVFDTVNGRLRVLVVDLISVGDWCFDLVGFVPLMEVTQTYIPSQAGGSLSFQTPPWPEGFAAADHFDTYWGHLTHPLDFTQAHPLQCNYPAAAPHVGDYLTVADTVPTPAPGQGVYYVTSATYQGATRYGRKATAGHLSGRDPAVLPVCETATTARSVRTQY